MWEYRARLSRVLDGDTLRLLIDTGFNGRQEEDFRLAAVSAPELSELGGMETRDFVEAWCRFAEQDGRRWPLLVHTEPNTRPEPEERRSFIRYIATVRTIAASSEPSLNLAVNRFLAEHPEWPTGM